METISVADAREQFADLMGKVAYGGQRIIVQRRGKPMMAWISLDDLSRLEAWERADRAGVKLDQTTGSPNDGR